MGDAIASDFARLHPSVAAAVEKLLVHHLHHGINHVGGDFGHGWVSLVVEQSISAFKRLSSRFLFPRPLVVSLVVAQGNQFLADPGVPVGFGVEGVVKLLTFSIPTHVGVIHILTILTNEVVESVSVVDGEGDAVDVVGNGAAEGSIIDLAASVHMLGQDAHQGGGDDFVAHAREYIKREQMSSHSVSPAPFHTSGHFPCHLIVFDVGDQPAWWSVTHLQCSS